MDHERDVRSKMRARILLPFMTLIIFSSLDRVNISFAALQMNQALGMTAESFGIAVGVFFVGYLLCQFPSTAIQRKIGTRRWIFGTVFFWGLCATGMAFVHNVTSLYVLRFLLGVAESGLTPGIVYYCSSFMPKRFRASAITITLLAIPISVIVGGPLSGWLMSLQNPVDMAGWRWMFLLEGIPTIALAFIAYFLFSDTPEQAHWLTSAEKKWLHQELENEQAEELTQKENVSNHTSFRALLSNGRIWAVAVVWFALLLGSNGIIFWLPQVLKQLSGASDFEVGVMSAVPWVGIGIGMFFNARHSDRTQERYWHVALATLAAALGLVLASWFGSSLPALAFLFVGGLGIGGAQGVFWTIPASLMSRGVIGSGITLINLIGNMASLTGPYLIGFFRQQTGSFNAPIYFIASVLVVSIFLLLTVRRSVLTAQR